MKCPHCAHDFPLTWARYIKSPFVRVTCPGCHRQAKLSEPLLHELIAAPVFVAIFALAWVGFFAGVYYLVPDADDDWGGFGGLAFALIVLLALRRPFLARFAQLKPV